MAPDTEPTEAELEAVMQAAARVVRERKQSSDAWLQRELLDTPIVDRPAAGAT